MKSSKKWERTFDFSASVEKLWRSFTDRTCEFRAWDPENAYLSNGAIAIEFTERTENETLQWTETEGDDRWDVSVSFGESETGCRVTIVRSGFGEGDDWLRKATTRFVGWNQVLCDIEVYFRTGTQPGRFYSMPWFTIGLDVVGAGGGVRVLGAIKDGMGARAGITKGDIVLSIDGFPMFRIEEFWMMERVVKARGGDVEFEFIRDGRMQAARAEAAVAS